MSDRFQRLLSSPHIKRLPSGLVKIEGRHGITRIWDIGMGVAIICLLGLLWMLISEGAFYSEGFIGFSLLLGISWFCATITDTFYGIHFERRQISYTHTFIVRKSAVICGFDEIHAISVDGELIGEGSGSDPSSWTYRVALIKKKGAIVKISGEGDIESRHELATLIAEALEVEYIPGEPMRELQTSDSRVGGPPKINFTTRSLSKDGTVIFTLLCVMLLFTLVYTIW